MGDGESADKALASCQESFKAFVMVALENKDVIYLTAEEESDVRTENLRRSAHVLHRYR